MCKLDAEPKRLIFLLPTAQKPRPGVWDGMVETQGEGLPRVAYHTAQRLTRQVGPVQRGLGVWSQAAWLVPIRLQAPEIEQLSLSPTEVP